MNYVVDDLRIQSIHRQPLEQDRLDWLRPLRRGIRAPLVRATRPGKRMLLLRTRRTVRSLSTSVRCVRKDRTESVHGTADGKSSICVFDSGSIIKQYMIYSLKSKH